MKILKFSTTIFIITSVINRFYRKYRLPGAIAAIDCTHIAITSPQGDPQHPEHIYVNRKNYHSINVQLVFYLCIC